MADMNCLKPFIKKYIMHDGRLGYYSVRCGICSSCKDYIAALNKLSTKHNTEYRSVFHQRRLYADKK